MMKFLILMTAFLIPVSAYAGQNACVKPASSIMLQSADDNRLEMARAFKTYLKKEGRDERIVTAMYKASIQSDVDFKLLVLKAMLESDLGRLNAAKTSTARGVFQYIEPTWLTLIRRYGDEIGYSHYADMVERSKYPGVPTVESDNPFLKAEILALRHNPEASALIKTYQIKEETDVIRGFKNGRAVTPTDHYIVHMLGLPLAKQFYAMKRSGSRMSIAGMRNPAMREAAKLNRAFFYEGKRALNARQSYNKFEKRINREFKKIYTLAKANKTPACTDKPASFELVNYTN